MIRISDGTGQAGYEITNEEEICKQVIQLL